MKLPLKRWLIPAYTNLTIEIIIILYYEVWVLQIKQVCLHVEEATKVGGTMTESCDLGM